MPRKKVWNSDFAYPIEYIADEKGRVKQVVLQKMELGEPDASGRRSPVAISGCC